MMKQWGVPSVIGGDADQPGGGLGNAAGTNTNTNVTSALPPADVGASGFATPQSQSAGPGLGAYDVWADQAFGGPSASENEVYQGTNNLASNTSSGQVTGEHLQGDVGENVTGQGTQKLSNQQLQNAFGGAQQMYTGNDDSSIPMKAQQAQYMTMVGPNAGYDAATKAAMVNEGNSALNSQEASMRDQLNNAQARSGSPVGAYGALVDVNQNIGNQRAAQARQNQVLFANEAERQKEAGATGLGTTAQEVMARQNSAQAQALAINQAQYGQNTSNITQANQLINDQTARQMAGVNSTVAQNAQQRGYEQAGGAGLTNLLQGQMGQQNQLYSMLASILGNKQGDTSQLNQMGVGLGATAS